MGSTRLGKTITTTPEVSEASNIDGVNIPAAGTATLLASIPTAGTRELVVQVSSTTTLTLTVRMYGPGRKFYTDSTFAHTGGALPAATKEQYLSGLTVEAAILATNGTGTAATAFVAAIARP